MLRAWNRLRQEQRPMRFLLSRILWKTGLCRLFTIPRPGFMLRFYPTSLSASLWLTPDDRHSDEQFLQDYLRPNDVYVDIGANIGALALLAAKTVGESGKVHVMEPHPRIFRYLQSNLNHNRVRNVISHNVALGDQTGSLRFSNKRSDDQNRVLTEGKGIAVPVLLLDDLLKTEPYIHLMKIDVEGYEPFVLRGAPEILQRTDCIYFEAGEKHLQRFQLTFADMFRLLTDAGFQTYRFLTENTLAPVANDYSPVEIVNLVAIRDAVAFQTRTGYRICTETALRT